MKKHTSTSWFIYIRGSYLPNTWQGWLLYVPYVAYDIGVLVFVLYHEYDVAGALFILVPNWIAALAIMSWIAQRASRPQ